MYRLIAADIDDTLLDPAGNLTERTRAAFKRAMEKGAYVVLASGRMFDSTRPYAEIIGVNAPVISYNGGMIYDMRAGRAQITKSISMETALGIARMAEKDGLYFQAYTEQGYFAREHTIYTQMYEDSIRVACNITGKNLSEWISGDLIKMLFIGPAENSPRIIEKFSKAFADVTFMTSKPHYVEVVAKGVDKSSALSRVLSDLGVKPEEMIAFGDGQNDISMLNMAGKGYCMLNARPHVRAMCNLFAPSNAQDGCAQIIEELLDSGKLGGA